MYTLIFNVPNIICNKALFFFLPVKVTQAKFSKYLPEDGGATARAQNVLFSRYQPKRFLDCGGRF